MKATAIINEIVQHQTENCRNVIASNVGKFYVRVYDCMMVLRLFL